MSQRTNRHTKHARTRGDVNVIKQDNTCPDAYIASPPSTAYVLAERAGGGNGRVYTIYFTASDGNGGSCSGSVKVSVPHDQKHDAVDDGPRYDSTVCSGGGWHS